MDAVVVVAVVVLMIGLAISLAFQYWPRTCRICEGHYRLGHLGEHFDSPACREAHERLGPAETRRRLWNW